MNKHEVVLNRLISGSLDTIALEMGATVTRTARSPIFNEAHDFTTAVFGIEDNQSHLVAQAPGCTIQLYAIVSAVNSALKTFKHDLHPGDIIIASDPYDGGTHIPDQVILTPVFFDRKPVLVPAVRAHMGDVGGPVPGGYNPKARDIWQDGIIVPHMKIVEKGEKRRAAFDLLIANNRLPEWLEGDLDAMIGACKLATTRSAKLISRYGIETVTISLRNTITYTENRVRAEIGTWKSGTFSAETYIDHDYLGHHDIPIRCSLTVKDSALLVDFSDSAPQVEGFVNSPLANTISFVFAAIAGCIEEDIPINEGLIKSVNINAPLGSVVNPTMPAPVGNCTCIPGAEISEVVLLAIEQAAPERVGMNSHKLPLAYSNGIDESGNRWVNLNFFGYTGGAGAAYGTDGWGLYPPLMTGVILPSIEMTEIQYPTRILKHEYIPDFTGAGLWRGAPGVETKIEYLSESRTNVMMAGSRHPARCFNGGNDGARNKIVMEVDSEKHVEVRETEFDARMPSGGILHFWRGGGSGWGNPLNRPIEKVVRDVQNEYITAKGAFADYGVVMSEDGGTANVEATVNERDRRLSGH